MTGPNLTLYQANDVTFKGLPVSSIIVMMQRRDVKVTGLTVTATRGGDYTDTTEAIIFHTCTAAQYEHFVLDLDAQEPK